MEQSLYLQGQHLSALDKFEKDLTQAKEESLLTHALAKSRLEEKPASKKSGTPLKGILKKSRRYVWNSFQSTIVQLNPK